MRRPARGARIAVAVWVLTIASGWLLLAAPPPQAPDLSTVLERVGRYVEQYQQDFSLLVCDERYTQEYQEPYALGGGVFEAVGIQKRRLLSEYVLARLEGDGQRLWQGFRDVLEVDGRPVQKERNRLEALFSASPEDLLTRARAVADESARYNLGQYRTINVPTLGLEYLSRDSRPRLRYEKAGEEMVTGVRTWRIAFEERVRPTLIHTLEGHDVPARGTVWVEPGTGRVIRTEIEPQHGRVFWDGQFVVINPDEARHTSKIVVTYAPDDRLGVWVPAKMQESHGAEQITVTGEATYSNFRRFETVARIKND